jgi:GNAT superfamily N-acetyltransferase
VINNGEATRHAGYRIRVATLADEPQLRSLIARSIRALGADDYTPAQIEAALTGAFGVDTSLIRDATYFVALDNDDRIVGCGGWSRRRTLFGSDARAERDESWLDPATDAAKIRAFFIDPIHARRGIGRSLLERCEQEATRAGFTRCELMATLPGQRLYSRYGYESGASIEHPLPGGLKITFVPMRKALVRGAVP